MAVSLRTFSKGEARSVSPRSGRSFSQLAGALPPIVQSGKLIASS